MPPNSLAINLSTDGRPAAAPTNLIAALAAQRPVEKPNYQPAKVNALFATVKRTFEQPVIWQNDLKKISAAFGTLSPPERRSLVNLLAKAPDSQHLSLLTRWLDRATSQGIGAFDGLDQKGVSQLWRSLVAGQDKANLARIFFAPSKAKNPSIGAGEYQRLQFARAIAATGTPQQKLDFVSALTPHTIAWSKDSATNTSGRAIAVVMAGLTDTKLISACVKTLGRAGMDAAVRASLPLRDAASVPGLESVDTKLFQAMAATMARSTNAREKAAFVSASGKALASLNDTTIGPNRSRKELGEVALAISTVIGTDTTGVIENVMMQNTAEGRSSGPAALKAYAQALLDAGNAADLGAITLQLQRGNDLQQDPMKYLGTREVRSGEQPTYSRARVMGGWLGLVGAAVQSRIGKRDTNAAYSSLLFTGSVDVMKELVGARFPGFKLAAGVLAPAVKTAINLGLLNWRNEATREDRSFAQSLLEGALPKHRNGVEATADWTQTMKTEQARRFINP